MTTHFLLPEWSPCRAVLLAWPYPGGDWDDNFDDVNACYWQLLTAIAAHAQAWILLHPSMDATDFKRRIEQSNFAFPARLRSDIAFDDTWIRDYGPLTRDDGPITFSFNGWGAKHDFEHDDAVAASLGDWLGQKPKAIAMIAEGGGLEINDDQVLLANEECLIDDYRNEGKDKAAIQDRLRECLGVKEFAWVSGVCLSGDDTDGHIDTMARFSPDNAIIYSGRNPAHHNAAQLNLLHEQIQALSLRWGWASFELPTPIVHSKIDGRVLPATYANFLICNKAVLLPIYGCAEDAAAIAVIEKAFVGRQVISINCSALVEQHGSLHCSTMQIPF